MSFGWLGTYRRGSWRRFRSFILEERRDLAKNIAVINSKLRKIGFVTVFYKRERQEDGTIRTTEERVGFRVSSGSSLEKLVQAYIANGGNPLDISFFFTPDKALYESGFGENVVLGEQYPYGGVMYPVSTEYDEPLNSYGQYPGGFIPLRKYPPLRTGGRRDLDSEAETFVNFSIYARRAANKAIRHKRNNIESNIIKLCDLREQLIKERDEIFSQAFGGASSAIQGFEPSRFVLSLRVPNIVDLIDSIFYERDEEGNIDFDTPNNAELTKYPTLLEDILPDEKNHAL